MFRWARTWVQSNMWVRGAVTLLTTRLVVPLAARCLGFRCQVHQSYRQLHGYGHDQALRPRRPVDPFHERLADVAESVHTSHHEPQKCRTSGADRDELTNRRLRGELH